MATKSYNVGPQDGWLKVIASGELAAVRITAFPHTKPFYVFGDPAITPTIAANPGVYTCHHPFKITSGDRKNADAFWVRVASPAADTLSADGRLRIDVYTDGGTLT
jgi:hypothetical protein